MALIDVQMKSDLNMSDVWKTVVFRKLVLLVAI